MLEQDQCLTAVTDLWERIAHNQKTHCQRREEHLAGPREQESQVSTESFSPDLVVETGPQRDPLSASQCQAGTGPR